MLNNLLLPELTTSDKQNNKNKTKQGSLPECSVFAGAAESLTAFHPHADTLFRFLKTRLVENSFQAFQKDIFLEVQGLLFFIIRLLYFCLTQCFVLTFVFCNLACHTNSGGVDGTDMKEFGTFRAAQVDMLHMSGSRGKKNEGAEWICVP